MSEVRSIDGKNVVIISDITFASRRKVDFNTAERYLRKYAGKEITVSESGDKLTVSKDFADEFCHSNDTIHLRGANRKLKANLIVAIEELVQSASNRREIPDYQNKHGNKAKRGWYRYDVYFAYIGDSEKNDIIKGVMVVRKDANGRDYLYDIVQIKKEASNPSR